MTFKETVATQDNPMHADVLTARIADGIALVSRGHGDDSVRSMMPEVGNRSTPFLVTSYMTVTPLAWPRCIRQDSCSFSMAAGGVDAKDTTVTRSVRQAFETEGVLKLQ